MLKINTIIPGIAEVQIIIVAQLLLHPVTGIVMVAAKPWPETGSH